MALNRSPEFCLKLTYTVKSLLEAHALIEVHALIEAHSPVWTPKNDDFSSFKQISQKSEPLMKAHPTIGWK